MTAALSIACVAIIACEGKVANERECSPGDYRYCDCASGKPGYQQCTDTGDRYAAADAADGVCDCSGTIPLGAGILVEGGVAADAADSGPAGFLAACINDTDCESKLCFAFNAYGPHCSMTCSKDTDCPAPSPGCSGMKVCKLH